METKSESPHQLASDYSRARWRLRFAQWRLAQRQRELDAIEQRIDAYNETKIVKLDGTIQSESHRTGLSKIAVRIARARLLRQSAAMILCLVAQIASAAGTSLPPFPKNASAASTAPVLATNTVPIVAAAPAPTPRSDGAVTLQWQRSPDASVTGYRVYWGAQSGTYTNSFAVGNVTNATVRALIGGATNYYAVTAYDAHGVESPFSNEAQFVAGVTGTISIAAWNYSNPGIFSVTNEIVISTDGLRTWRVLKTFVGDGLPQTIIATNTSAAVFRVRAQGQP